MADIADKTLSNGFSMPLYGMGTWQMGGRMVADASNDDKADLAALRLALDKGITHFDTAENYAAGRAEELLGEAIRGEDRNRLFLVTKVALGNQEPHQLRHSFEASCRRLGTDYLDMYMLHRYDSEVPIDETMGAMDDLVDEGRLRYPAVSNFTAERLEKAQAASRHKIVANQLHYNVQVREIEKLGVLDYCQRNDVMVVAWGALQKGDLDLNGDLMTLMMTKYQCTAAQLAINWLVSQSGVVTLSKTRSPAHLEENLGGLSFIMDDNDIELIRREMPNQIDRSDRVPLDYL